jgi:hypothetical protein
MTAKSGVVRADRLHGANRGGKQLRRREARRRVLPGFPVERPFQSRAEMHEYLSGDKLQCLRCGKWYKSLGAHLSTIHAMSPDDYRALYKINWRSGLESRPAHLNRSRSVRSHSLNFGIGGSMQHIACRQTKRVPPFLVENLGKYAQRKAE